MPPQNPWELMNQISEGNYFDPVINLKRYEKFYSKSDQRSSYLQALSTTLSYVGRYYEAQKYFEQNSSGGSNLDAPTDLSFWRTLDAVSELAKLGARYQVIMLNEAHHVPETRALTMVLLQPLYEQGFRYFAAETFNEYGVSETTAKRIPLRSTGYYTIEPIFADIVREALRIGEAECDAESKVWHIHITLC